MTGLLDQLAAKHDALISDLRLVPVLQWESLEDLYAISSKEQYPLKMWEDTVSYLLGCEVRFENYQQIEFFLKGAVMNQKYLTGFYVDETGQEICRCFEATAENLAAFLCQYAEYSHVSVSALDGTPFLSASYGAVEDCLDPGFLAEELFPVLLRMQLDETSSPEICEVPKEVLESYAAPAPDWSVNA